MKLTIAAAAFFLLAAPAAAQTADPHAAHKAAGHGKSEGHGEMDCCKDKNGNGKPDCCEGKDGARMKCCDEVKKSGDAEHKGH